jgi:8-oxo-dGTP pyrophosphatase MutT (NUDIX family)
MNDPRYKYDKVNAIKIILVSSDNRILLIKEPDTNEWMPGHWGLPGGKALVKESLYGAFNRKSQGDLGVNLEPLGIFRIEELLMEGRTVMMFHIVTKMDEIFKPKGEIAGYKWVGVGDLEEMDLTDFTEFFNRQLLLDYLKGDKELASLDLVNTFDYYKMSNDNDYKRWQDSGKKYDKQNRESHK